MEVTMLQSQVRELAEAWTRGTMALPALSSCTSSLSIVRGSISTVLSWEYLVTAAQETETVSLKAKRATR